MKKSVLLFQKLLYFNYLSKMHKNDVQFYFASGLNEIEQKVSMLTIFPHFPNPPRSPPTITVAGKRPPGPQPGYFRLQCGAIKLLVSFSMHSLL